MAMNEIREKMTVVGSDGEQIGTVDRVEGDSIKLAKNDPQASGQHHWVPQNWVSSVANEVRLNKPAREVRSQWSDKSPSM